LFELYLFIHWYARTADYDDTLAVEKGINRIYTS